MSFLDLNISLQYRTSSETGDILKDFYIPVLSRSVLYRRAVGYFTSKSLVLAAQGLASLIERGGKMDLIASPFLEKDDMEAILKGYETREKIIEKALIRTLEKPLGPLEEERLNYLAWLISNSQLDIKIAFFKKNSKLGLYHEKMGIMEDIEGNVIAFSGSSNETEGGLLNNYESIDVFCSWKKEDIERVQTKVRDFNLLWNNLNQSLDVVPFPTAVKERLLNFKKNSYKPKDPGISILNDKSENYYIQESLPYPKIPHYINLREYQKEAIKSWFENKCQGLLEMATGTGKTITALSAVSKLYEITKRLGVIIVCPYTHLVDQWTEELKEFNMDPIVAYSGKKWEEFLRNEISAFNANVINHFCLVTTNDTFGIERMQNIIKRLKGEVVFIADEAHHLGARHRRSKLLTNIPFRLALSATPNRWYDDEGTEKLLQYFGGKVVFEFGLEKAIGKYLTEYFYYPHTVYLEPDESEEYYEITRKLSRFNIDKDSKNDEQSKVIESLLIKRARILSGARNKLTKLKELMKEQTDSNFNIVYCGDSEVDGEKQIAKVIQILGNELNMRVHSFTSMEDNKKRKELLRRFSEGELQALVAIKCLDEGVDVPATQNAYILASSTNPREFIQRRGRVLRKFKNKKYSYVHDFIVLPRNIREIEYLEPSLFNIERKLLKRELTRFTEFASLAINGPQAHENLLELKKAYNLLDM